MNLFCHHDERGKFKIFGEMRENKNKLMKTKESYHISQHVSILKHNHRLGSRCA